MPMQRPYHIRLRFSEDERDAIKKAADDRGISMTQLFKRGVVKEAPELTEAILKNL